MAEKYEPTADVHNIFIFVLAPIIIHFVLSSGYKKFMKRIGKFIFPIDFAVFTVLPIVCFLYLSDFPEVYRKRRFFIIYFLVPSIIFYSLLTLVFAVKYSILSRKNPRSFFNKTL